ncbi:MAG: nucleotidyltransferase family protein [bacterium]|nr:nucleotidyltransferase family protein [bacterium]
MDKQLLKEKIRKAVEENSLKYEIKKVSLFGSYAYGVPRQESDVDILIEFIPDNKVGLFKFIKIKHDFEDYLQMKVDLATPDALSKYIREEVLQKSETLYDRK